MSVTPCGKKFPFRNDSRTCGSVYGTYPDEVGEKVEARCDFCRGRALGREEERKALIPRSIQNGDIIAKENYECGRLDAAKDIIARVKSTGLCTAQPFGCDHMGAHYLVNEEDLKIIEKEFGVGE